MYGDNSVSLSCIWVNRGGCSTCPRDRGVLYPRRCRCSSIWVTIGFYDLAASTQAYVELCQNVLSRLFLRFEVRVELVTHSASAPAGTTVVYIEEASGLRHYPNGATTLSSEATAAKKEIEALWRSRSWVRYAPPLVWKRVDPGARNEAYLS